MTMPSLEAFDAACRRWDEEEHRFLTLMAEADRVAEFRSAEERLNLAAVVETVRREARESKERVAALLVRVVRGA